MVEIRNENFSLCQIAASGQCFRMEPFRDGSYTVIARDKYLKAFQEGPRVTLDCAKEDFEAFWRRYFDLDTDYGAFISAIDENDSYLRAAAKFGSGIRILRQDIWETIVTFIISQQNNIPRIKKCIANICSKYGEQKTAPSGEVYRAFPRPEALAPLAEDALMGCNLGYRSKYVVRTAREVDSGRFDPYALYSFGYEKAREALLRLCGVGGKVADCICLFALHSIDAFPIDTHIKQVLAKQYVDGFPFERYKGFAGVLQQYMFFYDLNG